MNDYVGSSDGWQQVRRPAPTGLNKYLVKQTNAAGKHMRPQRGNPGKAIQKNFSSGERLKAMSSFYKQNVIKYPGAAKDFFMQNPGQLLKF